MADETSTLRAEMIHAIAAREGTARELAVRFGISVDELKTFAAANREALEAERRRLETPEAEKAITPAQLGDLWITNKYERLKRLQEVAEDTYDSILHHSGGLTSAEYSTVVREFRSYLMLAANELGQLLHRGAGDSGEGDSLSVEITGVNMDSLR